MHLKGFLRVLHDNDAFQGLTNDSPVGQVLRHDETSYMAIPFLFEDAYFVAFLQKCDSSPGIIRQETGLDIGTEVFQVKFCRADIAQLDSGADLFCPSALRELGIGVGGRRIFRFPDRLLDVLEAHMDVYHVHGYVFLPANEALEKLYTRVLRKPRVTELGFCLLPRDRSDLALENNWYAVGLMPE